MAIPLSLDLSNRNRYRLRGVSAVLLCTVSPLSESWQPCPVNEDTGLAVVRCEGVTLEVHISAAVVRLEECHRLRFNPQRICDVGDIFPLFIRKDSHWSVFVNLVSLFRCRVSEFRSCV